MAVWCGRGGKECGGLCCLLIIAHFRTRIIAHALASLRLTFTTNVGTTEKCVGV